jgi:hypothetical protein
MINKQALYYKKIIAAQSTSKNNNKNDNKNKNKLKQGKKSKIKNYHTQ